MAEEKTQLAHDIKVLVKQKQEADEALTRVLNATNTAKLEQERIDAELIDLKRRREEALRATEEMEQRRRNNETVIETQDVEIGRQVEKLETLTKKNKDAATDAAAFEAGAKDREERERKRIADMLEPEFAPLRKELADIRKERDEAEAGKKDAEKARDTAKDELNTLTASIEANKSILADLEAKREAKERELLKVTKELGETTTALTTQRDDLQARKAELTKELEDMTDRKTSLQKELEAEQAKVDAKIAEYKKEEKRVFAVADREVKLNQRIAFIREKYERAGIPFPEIP